jgi:V-type H+-transporting ATPase subunit C
MKLEPNSVRTPRNSTNTHNHRGTYAARDLTDLLVEPVVTQQDFLDTKFISTLIVIVPTTNCQEFEQDHGMITDYVIPGSAKKFSVPDKDGLTLW